MKSAVLAAVVCILASHALAEENKAKDWSGVFLGPKTGFAAGGNNLRTVSSNTNVYPDFGPGQSHDQADQGAYGGVEMNYNWQSDRVVFGAFGSFSLMNVADKTWATGACCGSDDIFRTKLSQLGIVGGRIGYAPGDLLLYVGAGAAAGRYELTIADQNTQPNGAPSLANSIGGGSKSKWLAGGVLSAGVEYAFDERWTAGFDYAYIRFAGKDFDAGGSSFTAGGVPNGNPNYVLSPDDFSVHMFGVSLKYRLPAF